jgi:hypothetical protein
MIGADMTKNELKNDVKARAIADYINTNLKVVEIAERHKISIPRLSAWVREVGVPRRPRGSRQLTEPSTRANKVLAHAAVHGFSDAARHFNITRQLVSSLARRWGVKPPKLRPASGCPADRVIPRKKRKSRREVVVSFRLRKDELSLLRMILPPSVTQSVSSVHKLARAAILDRLENAHVVRSPGQHWKRAGDMKSAGVQEDHAHDVLVPVTVNPGIR